MKLTLSLFDNTTDTKPKVVERSWEQMCKRLAEPQRRASKDGQLFSPAIFKPAYRLKENVVEVSALIYDCDHDDTFDSLKERSQRLPGAFGIHTTHSHRRKTESNPKAEERFRLIRPLVVPAPADIFDALWQYVAEATGIRPDRGARDSSRMYFTPTRFSADSPYEYYVEDGPFLDWRKLDLPIAKKPQPEVIHSPKNGHRDIDALLTEAFARDASTFPIFQGDTSLFGGDRSRADMSLASRFARIAKDPSTLEAMLWRSPSARPEKWNERHYGDGRTYLQGLIDKAMEGLGQVHPNGNGHQPKTAPTTEPDPSLRFVRMADIVARPVDWLWKLYIALGALTIFEGPPGVGKSTLLCVILAAVTRGGKGLNGMGPFESSNVLLCSAEDSKSHTLRPRLDAAGADVSRVFALDEPLTLDAKGLLKLKAFMIEHKPKCVVFDPFFAYTGAKTDIHRANEMREITAQITAIAEEDNCAMVALRHLAKSRGFGHALNAGVGSIDLVAAARSVILVGQDPDDGRKRAMVQIKSNLGPLGPAIGFTIEDGVFYWTGDTDMTADRMLSLAGNQEEHTAVDEAIEFLRESLATGDRETGEVIREAKRIGITDKTLRSARERLKIRARREGLPGTKQRFYWSLPESTDQKSAPAVYEDFEINVEVANA